MTGEEVSAQIGIEVNDVSFSYGVVTVLEHVHLCVPTGEMWALLGRSGTGKTTLLNIIAGLFQPDSGHISVSGRRGVCTSRIRGVVF